MWFLSQSHCKGLPRLQWFFWSHQAFEGHIFCTEIKILNPGSRDISQKLRQTKCLLFNFWMIRLTKTPILPNCQVQNSFFFCIIVHFNLQILKIIHLVCLSFWDISRDPDFRISISVQKMWPWGWQKRVEKVAESQRNWLKRPLAKIAASLLRNTLADPVRNCPTIENWKIKAAWKNDKCQSEIEIKWWWMFESSMAPKWQILISFWE